MTYPKKYIQKNFYKQAATAAVLASAAFLWGGHATLASAAPADSAPAPAATIEQQALRNGFGTTLKPTVKRTAARQKEMYEPIKKQDDASQIPEIEMFVGESRVYPTPGVARIAVGNGQIMSAAALDEKEVILFANAVGTSSLFVWNEDGRYQRIKVTIVPGETMRYAREVAAFLIKIPGAKASVVGDKVIVEGDELSDADRDKVSELAKRYPQIVNFTSPIGWEQTVMMDVKVVEFPKTELRELGLKWNTMGGGAIGGIWSPGGRGNAGDRQINIVTGQSNPLPITNSTGNGSAVVPSALTVISAINVGLNAQLNLLEQNGSASVLAEPQLSTRSGFKASFLAGGEIPYSVSNVNGVTVMFKPYGIKLDIEPKVGRSGIIRAVIESEVSSLDASVTTTSGPGLLTRRTKTEFNVKDGETIVLSGLLQRNTSTDIDKVPLLGDIPVLGALFRSKRFQNKETELVVFVTPSIVDSRSPGLLERTARTTERLGQTLGAPPYLSSPLQPGNDAAKFNQTPVPVTPPATAPATPAKSDASGAPGTARPVPISEPAPVKASDSAALTPASQNPLQMPP